MHGGKKITWRKRETRLVARTWRVNKKHVLSIILFTSVLCNQSGSRWLSRGFVYFFSAFDNIQDGIIQHLRGIYIEVQVGRGWDKDILKLWVSPMILASHEENRSRNKANIATFMFESFNLSIPGKTFSARFRPFGRVRILITDHTDGLEALRFDLYWPPKPKERIHIELEVMPVRSPSESGFLSTGA